MTAKIEAGRAPQQPTKHTGAQPTPTTAAEGIIIICPPAELCKEAEMNQTTQEALEIFDRLTPADQRLFTDLAAAYPAGAGAGVSFLRGR